MGAVVRAAARAHCRAISRSPALHPGACRTHRLGSAAIPGQLADPSCIQRARVADEPGRKGRPVPEADRKNGAIGLRTRREAALWLAENSSALLPEPGRTEQMAGTVTSEDVGAARP